MSLESILSSIDAEISRLQQVRAMLSDNSAPAKRSVGRPKKNAVAISASAAPKKRTMSPEGKARIAAAQKKRWAAMKKKA